jgi:DNA repair exonuclease SbcCD nuclease subunit
VIHTFGARNDNLAFHDYFEKFYSQSLFPYLEANNISTVIQLGDLFERRKYINFLTLYKARKYFFDPCKEKNINLITFVGNHDVFYKDSNHVNSPELLLNEYPNITVHANEPSHLVIDDLKIALLPWVNNSNYGKMMSFVEETDAPILLGHLELAGFEMHRGSFNDHGMDVKLFSKFDIVCSGHYHHKSSRGNINYLGTPYEMSWSDFNDPRGFHIFDTETREITFIRNPFMMFTKIFYDDSNKELQDFMDMDVSSYKGSYVKVVINNKNNPYWFDMFITKLEESGVIDIQVLEDKLNINLEDVDDIVDEAEDTLTILRKVVEQIETTVEKKSLDKLLADLYNEALHQGV